MCLMFLAAMYQLNSFFRSQKKKQFVAIKEAFLSKESNTEVDVSWLYWGLTPL